MKEELLTLEQLAAETGIPRKQLYRLCAPAGDLVVVRVPIGPSAKRKTNGVIRVRRSEWDAWVERHSCAPPAETTTRVATRQSIADLPGAGRYVS